MVAGILCLALAPDALSLGPVRHVARYTLVAYLPGLVLWNRWKPPGSGWIDQLLFPSLLSVLPFCWGAATLLALGLDLRGAAWITVALFLTAAIVTGWSGRCSASADERITLAAVGGIALALLGVPFAANSFSAPGWDAPMHAAIATRILDGRFPPDSPFMAGQPVNYYWLYHLYTASLSRITGLGLYQVFALLNLHAFVLFGLAGHRIVRRLTPRPASRAIGAWLLVFGLNPLGWLFFAIRSQQQPDPWYSLIAPLEMVWGYAPQLGSLIHQFLDGNPFPVSFAFGVAWLDGVLRQLESDDRPGTLLTGTILLASMLHLHSLGAALLVVPALCALALTSRGLPWRARRRLWTRVSGVVVAAGLLTLPYAWHILHGKAGTALPFELTGALLDDRARGVGAALGLLAVLALPAIARAGRGPAPLRFLTAFAFVAASAALVVRIEAGGEYKLIYTALLGLAPLAAWSWETWRGNAPTRWVFLSALVLCAPANLLTSYAFTVEPPREERPPHRTALMKWVREQTPEDSILVEFPYWLDRRASLAEYHYLDRYWFDIAVYGRRRQLAGYTSDVLDQWGYRDVGPRQALSNKLLRALPLSSADVEYLRRLDAPLYAVPHTAARPSVFETPTYDLVYAEGSDRVYRVNLPEPGTSRPAER